MAGTTNPEPAVKRQKTGEKNKNVPLRDLPANLFFDKTQLYADVNLVNIQVEGKNHRLPKALMCYSSGFFERAFKARSKDGEPQTINLRDTSLETWTLALQWIYTSNIVLPSGTSESQTARQAAAAEDDVVAVPGGGPSVISYVNLVLKHPESQNLSRLLAFMKLADKIDLIGPFDTVNTLVRQTLTTSRRALEPAHIRTAATFPAGHEVRKLVVQACVKEYIEYMMGDRSKVFRFSSELAEMDSFAADLLHEVTEIFRKRCLIKTGKSPAHTQAVDPLSGDKIDLTKADHLTK